MKKLYQIIIIIAWAVSGVSGAIKYDLKHYDLTVGRLTGSILIGSCLGPTAWMFYLLDSDTVLIKREA